MRTMGDATDDPAESERLRLIVLDAVLELVQEGSGPIEIDDLVTRSGITEQQIRGLFVNIGDIREQVVERFKERFRHLYLMEGPAVGPLADRLRVFVDARIRLMGEVGPVIAFARTRAREHQILNDGLTRMRVLLREQVHYQFSLELHDLTASNSEALVSIVDTFTSPEAWEVLRLAHQRTQRQIRSSWLVGLRAIFEAWQPSRQPSLSDLLMANRRSPKPRDL